MVVAAEAAVEVVAVMVVVVVEVVVVVVVVAVVDVAVVVVVTVVVVVVVAQTVSCVALQATVSDFVAGHFEHSWHTRFANFGTAAFLSNCDDVHAVADAHVRSDVWVAFFVTCWSLRHTVARVHAPVFWFLYSLENLQALH